MRFLQKDNSFLTKIQNRIYKKKVEGKFYNRPKFLSKHDFWIFVRNVTTVLYFWLIQHQPIQIGQLFLVNYVAKSDS